MIEVKKVDVPKAASVTLDIDYVDLKRLRCILGARIGDGDLYNAIAAACDEVEDALRN